MPKKISGEMPEYVTLNDPSQKAEASQRSKKTSSVAGKALPTSSRSSATVERETAGFKRSHPEALYDIDFVCQKIISVVGGAIDVAIEMVENLCQSRDPRFNAEVKGVGSYTFDGAGVVGKLKELQTKETARKQEKVEKGRASVFGTQKKSAKGGSFEKLQRKVAMQLVGLVNRNDVTVKSTSGYEITQRTGHAETVFDTEGNPYTSLSSQQTAASAEIPKHERDARTVANTSILTGSDDSVVCTRSGKTQKPHLQEQRSQFDIVARAEATTSKRLKKMKDGECVNGLACEIHGKKRIFVYQPMLFSMMDSAQLKAVGTSLQGFAKRVVKRSTKPPIENERVFLQKMKKANVDRFSVGQPGVNKGTPPFRTHNIVLGDGEQFEVHELPAIIQNHVYSSQANSAENRKAAKKANIDGQMKMLDRLLLKHPSLFQKQEYEDLKNNLDDPESITVIMKQVLGRVEGPKDSGLHMVIQAFHANLAGIPLPRKASKNLLEVQKAMYDRSDSAADFAHWAAIQADYLGLSFSPQCKSGNDRTASAVATAAARKIYKQAHGGKEYNPESCTASKREEYARYYSDALREFGFSNTEASRGPVKGDRSSIKIAKSRAAHKYYREPINGGEHVRVRNYGIFQ